MKIKNLIWILLPLGLIACGKLRDNNGVKAAALNAPPTVTFHINQNSSEILQPQSTAHQVIQGEARLYAHGGAANHDEICKAHFAQKNEPDAIGMVSRNQNLTLLPELESQGEIYAFINSSKWKSSDRRDLNNLILGDYLLCVYAKTGKVAYASVLTISRGGQNFKANLNTAGISQLYLGGFDNSK